MTQTAIIAGSFNQARLLADAEHLRPPEWFYVADVSRLRGVRDVSVVFCGTWGRRADAPLLSQMTDTLIAQGRATEREPGGNLL